MAHFTNCDRCCLVMTRDTPRFWLLIMSPPYRFLIWSGASEQTFPAWVYRFVNFSFPRVRRYAVQCEAYV